MLDGGGAALDAVEAAIHVLENDPLFNAGRGAVFTADGRVELDSAIMDGATLAAGAVAGLTRARNPISAARAVMERSPHVLMTGSGLLMIHKIEGTWMAVSSVVWFLFGAVFLFIHLINQSRFEVIKEIKGVELRLAALEERLSGRGDVTDTSSATRSPG